MFLGAENQLLRDLINSLHQYSLAHPEQENLRFFNRYVSPDGQILMSSKEGSPYVFNGGYHYDSPDLVVDRSSASDLRRLPDEFFQLSAKMVDSILHGEHMNKAEGPIPGNYLMVLLLALKPLLRDLQDGEGRLDLDTQGSYHAYAVSGPSMIKYTSSKDFKKNLAELYQSLRELGKQQFSLNMPGNLILHMIPGASLSYLPVKGETQALDALNKFAEVDAAYRRQQEVMQSHSGSKPPKDVLMTLNQVRTQHKDAIRDLVDASVNLPHISQYDLLAGQELLDPSQLEAIGTIAFKEHLKIAALLEEARQKLSTSKV